MPFDARKNFAISKVAVAPSPAASGLSLTLTTGEGALMAAPPFDATIGPDPAGLSQQQIAGNSTIVRVSSIVGDVVTFTRQAEGSNNRSILVGDYFIGGNTVKATTDIENALISGMLPNKFMGQTGDFGMITRSGASIGAGQPNYSKVPIVNPGTISKVYYGIFQAGSGAQLPVNCYVGVFNSITGNRLGVSADQSTNWQSTGLKGTSIILDAGQTLYVNPGDNVHVGWVIGTQSTTTVALTRQSSNILAVEINAGLVAADGFRAALLGTGFTALPTSIVVANMTSSSSFFIAAVA